MLLSDREHLCQQSRLAFYFVFGVSARTRSHKTSIWPPSFLRWHQCLTRFGNLQLRVISILEVDSASVIPSFGDDSGYVCDVLIWGSSFPRPTHFRLPVCPCLGSIFQIARAVSLHFSEKQAMSGNRQHKELSGEMRALVQIDK